MKISFAVLAAIALACVAQTAPVEADTQDNAIIEARDRDDYRPGWRCYRYGWRRRCFRCPYGRCGGGYGGGGGYPELIKRDEVTTEAAQVGSDKVEADAAEPIEMYEEPVEAYRYGYGYGPGWGYGHRHGWRGGWGYGGGW